MLTTTSTYLPASDLDDITDEKLNKCRISELYTRYKTESMCNPHLDMTLFQKVIKQTDQTNETKQSYSDNRKLSGLLEIRTKHLGSFI